MLLKECNPLAEWEYVSNHHMIQIMLWKQVGGDVHKLYLIELLCPAEHQPIILYAHVMFLLWKVGKAMIQLFQAGNEILEMENVGFLSCVECTDAGPCLLLC